MTDTRGGTVSEQRISCHRMDIDAAPWFQEQVRLDGQPIGYLLYRHIWQIPGLAVGQGWSQYLVSDAAHRPAGPRCSFLGRDVAVAALVAEVTAGAEAA